MQGESMRRAVLRYLELVAAGDVDGVVALMADDVSVEDPVGGPPATQVVGREQVRAFFRAGFARAVPRPGPIGPVCCTAAEEAAVSFRLVLALGGRDVELDVIDVVRFDEAARSGRCVRSGTPRRCATSLRVRHRPARGRGFPRLGNECVIGRARRVRGVMFDCWQVSCTGIPS